MDQSFFEQAFQLCTLLIMAVPSGFVIAWGWWSSRILKAGASWRHRLMPEDDGHGRLTIAAAHLTGAKHSAVLVHLISFLLIAGTGVFIVYSIKAGYCIDFGCWVDDTDTLCR